MTVLTATPDPTTGTVLVQIESSILRDTFTRNSVNSWGAATPTGQVYTNLGTATAFQVNGTTGQHIHSAANQGRISFTNVGVTSGRIKADISVPALASGVALVAYLMLRYTDDNNYYMARIGWTTGAAITVTLRKRVLAVETNLVSYVTPLTHVAGTVYTLEFDLQCTTLRARLWQTSLANPTGWQAEAEDFDLTTGSNAGFRTVTDVGSTQAFPFTYSIDNMVLTWGQDLHLYRVTPDGETEVLGSPFNTNEATAGGATATATMWDPTAPFDTEIFYRVRNDCGDLLLDSAPVTLDSMGTGWLRDPVDPTRNFRIVLDDFFDPCEDEDIIVFSGLGDPEYANASGIFPIIDNARPNTVSQTRQNYSSSLTLTSFSLDDTLTLEDILEGGRILSLSLPTYYGWALRTFGTDFITIDDVNQIHLGSDQRVTTRVWTIPFLLSPEPADPFEGGTGGNGIGGGGATYDDLAASVLGTTYNTLIASGETYDQVAAGTGY